MGTNVQHLFCADWFTLLRGFGVYNEKPLTLDLGRLLDLFST